MTLSLLAMGSQKTLRWKESWNWEQMCSPRAHPGADSPPAAVGARALPQQHLAAPRPSHMGDVLEIKPQLFSVACISSLPLLRPQVCLSALLTFQAGFCPRAFAFAILSAWCTESPNGLTAGGPCSSPRSAQRPPPQYPHSLTITALINS